MQSFNSSTDKAALLYPAQSGSSEPSSWLGLNLGPQGCTFSTKIPSTPHTRRREQTLAWFPAAQSHILRVMNPTPLKCLSEEESTRLLKESAVGSANTWQVPDLPTLEHVLREAYSYKFFLSLWDACMSPTTRECLSQKTQEPFFWTIIIEKDRAPVSQSPWECRNLPSALQFANPMD